uniref:LipD protein, putative n=1 Tax=Chlorobium chlorochromatii (strain CaD3) TaxID=340177 RepID=Q3AUC5_CHLCH
MKLSLADALSRAREQNYTVKAARSRIAQAEGQITQSRQSLLPKVTLSETFMVTNDPGAALVYKLQHNTIEQSDFMPSKLNNADVIDDFHTSVQVMQPIYNADAKKGRSMALVAKKGQEFMAERTAETIALHVSKAYYGLLLARKNSEAIDGSLAIMQGYNAETARGFNVGMLSRSDKLSTEVRLAELQEQKMMMEDEIKNATDALRVLLNLDPTVTIVPTTDLNVDGSMPSVKDGGALEQRSDLQAMEVFRQVASLQAEMADASRLPRVNAFAQGNLHGATPLEGGSSWALGVNVQWNILDAKVSEGQMQEAKAKKLEAMYSYEAAKSSGTAEINRALRSLKTAKARLAIASKSLEGAKVSFDHIGKQYKTGMAMTMELLMREQAFTYAKMRLNQAAFDYNVAKSELEYYKGN